MIRVLIASLLSGLSIAAVDIEPTPIGRWPIHMRGVNSAMALQGTRLYFSAARDLIISDISNSPTPEVLGVYYGASAISSITVSGDYAFIAESAAQRIRILDVSNPASPIVVTSVVTIPFPRAVALSGNLLFVGGGGGVQVFDVSDPTNPISYSKLTSASGVWRLAATGTTCFTVHLPNGGLKILDFSNPAGPAQVKVLMFGAVTDVAIDGNYLYGDSITPQIYDITDPLNPTLVGNGIRDRYVSVQGSRALSTSLSAINYWNVADPAAVRGINSLTPAGSPESIALDGDRGFVGTFVGVQVLALPIDGSASQIGFFDTDGVAAAMARSDNFVLVADGKAGLRIIDAADPRTPKLVSTYHVDAGGEARDITVQGRMAYLTTDTGFQFIDFSTPLTPRLVGSIPAAFPTTFAVSGALGYMSTFGDDLAVMDISDPSNAKPLTTVTNAKYISKLKIGDHYAIGCKGIDGTLVLDFSNSRQPTVTTTLGPTFPSADAEVVGDYAFIVGTTLYRMDLKSLGSPVTTLAWEATFAVARDGNRLVATSPHGLNVFDISAPLSPVNIGFYAQSSAAAKINAALVMGSFAVIAAGAESVQFLDLTQRSNPQSIAKVSGDRIGSIDAQADLIAARTSNGNLLLFDAQISSQPRLLSTLPVLPGFETSGGVAFAGDTVYCGAGGNGVAVVDIGDPLQPTQVNAFDTPGNPVGLLVDQNRLYVCDNSSFMILDITDRRNPSSIGVVAIPALSCTIVGTRAFVACGSSGLYIVDISSPASPIILGQYRSPGVAREVAVIGDVALLADSFDLPVVDISDPSAPRRLRLLQYQPQSIVVSGSYAYIADQIAGVNVLDISDPTNPVRVSGNSAFELVEKVRIHNNHILAAGLRPSLTILSLFGPLPPEISLLAPIASDRNLRLRVQGTAGTSIRIQRSSALPTWTDWMPLTLDGSVMEIEDTGALSTSGSAFYRAVAN